MKLERLNKDNIKEFIRDMKLDDNDNLMRNVDKSELYGLKKDDVFYLGFNSLVQTDTIAILNYNPKISDELLYECIDFLNKSLVVENHLIIEVYNDKYMKLLDDKYKCKDLIVSLGLNGNVIDRNDIIDNNISMKEKLVDIEMKSIKYYASKDAILCNLVKQNIQDEKVISDLHDSFVRSNVKYVSFCIFADSLDYFKELGYKCISRSYVIRNV